jgi:hypothetical protein
MKFQPTMLGAYADALWARTQQYLEGDMVIFLPLFSGPLGFGIAGALALAGYTVDWNRLAVGVTVGAAVGRKTSH